MPYYIEKRCYSERARLAGHIPYVYRRLRSPFKTMQNILRSFAGFKNLMTSIMLAYGAGRYKIFRSQFEGESPSWKMVCLVEITENARVKIKKRYTQYKSHPDDPQLWFKEHQIQLHFSLDIKETLDIRRRRLWDQHRRRVEALKPKRYHHVIQGKSWKYERD
jgi:hypothetical protein